MRAVAVHVRIVAHHSRAASQTTLTRTRRMQLASIPKQVFDANHRVVGRLQQSAATTRAVQADVERSGMPSATAESQLGEALAAARDAAAGAASLVDANLLDGTFHRYARHSVRDLERVVGMLDRPLSRGSDALEIFTGHLFDAEVSTRLGAAAGVRSLERPSPRALERTSSATAGAAADSGPSWVDGAWLDSIGNPVRHGGTWAGPDGERYGPDGSPASDGGYAGPDGESYSGLI